MADLDKTIEGLREMSFRASWDDIDRERDRFQPIINTTLELLGHLKGLFLALKNVTDVNEYLNRENARLSHELEHRNAEVAILARAKDGEQE